MGSPGSAEQELRTTDSHPQVVRGAQGAHISHCSAEQPHAGSGATHSASLQASCFRKLLMTA